MRNCPHLFRHALLTVAFVALFLLLNLPGTIIFAKPGSYIWYPGSGLAFALMLGVSPWYVFLVAFSGTLAGGLIYQEPLHFLSQTLGSAGVSSCYAAAAYCLRGPFRIDFTLFRGRDVLRYLTATTTAALVATMIASACSAADHMIPWSGFWSSSYSWFVGDEIGLLGMAPFLLIHVVPWIRTKFFREPIRKYSAVGTVHPLEAVGQALSVLVVLGLMFWPPLGNHIFFCFVPILWMGLRQGLRRATTGMVGLTFGIVIAIHQFPPPPFILSRMGIDMLVVCATGLLVGATVTERLLVETNLRERTVYLNSMIENSPLGIVVLGREGRVEMANAAFTQLFLFDKPSELMGSRLHDLFPINAGENSTWSQQVISGRSFQSVQRRQRRDGKILDLEMHAVPLVVDGDVRGAYAMCRDISEQVRASEAERKHAAALNQLVKELEVQTDQMTLLNDMASMLECCTSRKEASGVVRESTRKLFPEAILGGLYTFRASRNLIEAAISWGDPGPSHSVFAPEDCWALRRGQPRWSDTGGVSTTCAHLEDAPSAAHLCIPMMGRGEALGILTLGFADCEQEPPSLRYSRQRLGIAVAAQIAISLSSLHLREELRNQSIRDPLTGLFNRRFMQESLEREMIRARRKNRALSILFLDIDHFKRFNDTFGHDAGDFVLQSVAELLSRSFRGDDVPCRWGGEEFAVILPECTSQQSALRAQSLGDDVKRLNLQYCGTSLAAISLSIGVATFPDHASTGEDLVKIADQSLYQAKSSGRDCVTVAGAVNI